MNMNEGAVLWIIFGIQIPPSFPKQTKKPTLTPCLPEPNTPSNRQPFSTTGLHSFKATRTTRLLVISFVWGRTYTSWVADWPHTGRIIYILGRQGIKSQENVKFFPPAKRAFLHYNKLFISSENVSNTCTFMVMSNKCSENGYCISHSSSVWRPHSNFLFYASSEILVSQGWALINYWNGLFIIIFFNSSNKPFIRVVTKISSNAG